VNDRSVTSGGDAGGYPASFPCGSVTGTLGELGAGSAQVPADELPDDSGAIVAVCLGRELELIPELLLEPDASHLVQALVCHSGGVYGRYARCRDSEGVRVDQSHACSVCPLYVQFKVLSSTKTGLRPRLAANAETRHGLALRRGAAVETLPGQSRSDGLDGPKYCECGCGSRTPVAKRTRIEFGHVKGQPTRFVKGHHGRRNPSPQWLVKDCGYLTPCRLWQHHLTRDGYGVTKVRGRSRSSHVVEWEAVNGPVPEGLQMDHLCRQRACGEPTHLEPVPQIVNLQRGLVAKLNPEAVLAIRASTLPSTQLAEEFGVAVRTITSVRTGERWPNVGGSVHRRAKGRPRGRTGGAA
jgi:hypothetical protein